MDKSASVTLAACLAAVVVGAAAHGALRRSNDVTTLPSDSTDATVADAAVAASAAVTYTAPSNDMFAHRAALSSSTLGSLLLATGESGEPTPTLYPVQASIWYEWTSAVTGSARVGLFYASGNISEVGDSTA